MTWAPAGAERYRLSESSAPAPAVSESSLQSVASPSAAAAAAGSLFSVENPLLAFGVIAGLTFGLMAFSTSGTVRVGKTKLTGGLGVGST